MTAYVSRAEQAAETIYQALIEAELAWVIGPLPMSGWGPGLLTGTVTGRGRSPLPRR
jgi:hypothetical protein